MGSGAMPVVLLTDFGSRDPYVGQLKGVLHRGMVGVSCIDLFHDLPPFAVGSGAWLLERCLPHMPESAVWIAVVDPGVGGERRCLAVQWRHSFFVGPDNGLLTPILARSESQAVCLDVAEYAGASATFHGRDLFAPAAVRILQGIPLAALGNPVTDPVLRYHPGWGRAADGWRTEVMMVDHYGNLITALPGTEITGKAVSGHIENQPCGPLVTTFSSVAKGMAAMVVGGFGTVEVVVNRGRAAEQFECGAGAELRVRRRG